MARIDQKSETKGDYSKTGLTQLTHSYINKKYAFYDIEEDIDEKTFYPIKLVGIDVSIANALRRIFTDEIPCMGFDQKDIKIYKNTSQYHREVLIERFGFITINMEAKYDFTNLTFAICDPSDPEKPLKNDTKETLKVFVHQHLYVQNDGDKKKIPTDKVCPFNSILLTLNPGESIHVVMKPQMGIGKKHPIWQTSITMYKFETMHDTIDGKHETNEEQMDFLGKTDLEKNPSGIILTVESVGKYDSINVIKKGIDVLKNKLKTFSDNLKSVIQGNHNDNIVIDIDKNMVKITIKDEDHTLGNVLEWACLDQLKVLVGDNTDLLLECLCSYRNPHPLDKHIELIVRTPQSIKLVFPKGKQLVEDQSLALVLLSVDHAYALCTNKLKI
jgi:DNA-directed RNA polymerase subunit L